MPDEGLSTSDDAGVVCPENGQLDAYASGSLELRLTRRTEDHLAHCPQCSRRMERHGLREVDGRPLQVGRYRILDWLGESAHGVVYRAWDPQLCRCVAIKLLTPDPHEDPAAMKRRLGQARTLIRLSHRHVARVFDTGFDDRGQLYVVTELIAGRDLEGWLARGPRAWTEIISVFRRIARGLAAAHAADVVHGDLSDSNILLGDDGRVCVADFGGPAHLAGAERGDDVRQLCERMHQALGRASAGRVPSTILGVVERGRRGEIESMEALLAGLDKPRRLRAVLIGPAIAIGILIGLGSAYALAG